MNASRSTSCLCLSADEIENPGFDWVSVEGFGTPAYNEYSAVDHTKIPGWLLEAGGVRRFKYSGNAFSGSFYLGLGNSGNAFGTLTQVRQPLCKAARFTVTFLTRF
jgi:hypothetical protein